MFYYKLKKYFEGVGFVEIDIQNTISASYNKAENEYGQFQFTTYVRNNSKDVSIDDIIELWAGENRLAIGFVVELSYKEEKVDITCLTEEYKLEKILLPSDYTINTAGLNLENLADFLRRRYWQVRWNGEYDFADTSKITYKGSGIKIGENIHVMSNYANLSEEWFSYQLIEYYNEVGTKEYDAGGGITGTRPYDRVAIIDIHDGYFDTVLTNATDIAKTSRIKNYVSDDFLKLKVSVSYIEGSSVETELNYRYDGKNELPNSIIVGIEVVGGRNSKIKLFLNSKYPNYAKFEQQLTLSPFKSDIPLTPAPPIEWHQGITVETKGSLKNSEVRFSGWLNFSDGKYEGYKLERVRYAETYLDFGESPYRGEPTNKFLGKFFSTSGIYDSSKIPTSITSSDVVRQVMFPNENTEKVGHFFGGVNSIGEDFYFSFFSNVQKLIMLPETNSQGQEIRYDDKFLWNICITGLEFVMYKNYVSDYEVDSSIQDLYATNFEVDKNTNYEVLQKVCSELNVHFYVEDDRLYIKDKSAISSSSYNLKEGVNCKVVNHSINNENSYNFYIIEGAGDSPISKPMVNPRVEHTFEEVSKSKFLEVNYKEKTKLVNDLLNDKIIQYNGLSDIYAEKTLKIELEIINGNIIKVGDKINITTKSPVKSYKNIFVQEVTYQQKGELLLQKIVAGNSNKKLN